MVFDLAHPVLMNIVILSVLQVRLKSWLSCLASSGICLLDGSCLRSETHLETVRDHTKITHQITILSSDVGRRHVDCEST